MGKSNNKNKSNQKEKDTKEKVVKTEKKEIDKDKVILSIQNASYRYSDAAEDEYALRDFSYDFEKGKIYAIRGRSGTGKTTLLSLISGLERCTEGTILFGGKNLKDINLDTYRNSQIGIVFQSYNLLPYMTASENIILSMDASGGKIENKKQKAIELMESVGLKSNYADRKVLRLSGGEQQRVAIARSLSYNPKMIVADEPTGNLDKQTESEILDIFKKLAHEEGKCVIDLSTDMENVWYIVKMAEVKNITVKHEKNLSLKQISHL